MARLSIGDKAQRTLTLLMGARLPRIQRKLAPHGFSRQELEEGFALLRKVVVRELAKPGTPLPEIDPLEVRRVDEWENKWFPIAAATLKRHDTALGERLFLNLNQTEGPAVVLGVATFLTRLKEIEKEPDGKAALKRLASRGLTKVVLDDAQQMVDKLTTSAEVETAVEEPDDEEDAAYLADVEAMWGWYLEWSVIVRSVVTSRTDLRTLGFLKDKKSASESESDVDADAEKGSPV